MMTNKNNRQHITTISISCLMIAVFLMAGSSSSEAQFLPQSNLGRLVQSIAGSPLVLGLPHASASMSSFDSDSPSSGYGGDSDGPPAYGPPGGYYGAGHEGSSASGGPTSRYPHNQQVPLQQAPSQQHRNPQRFIARNQHEHQQQHQRHNDINSMNRDQNQQDSLDEDEPRGFDQGRSPSNARPSQEYQMGAYLGPTMDDKELNGVFNSNNDDRDDVESGPGSGYDEGASEARGASSQKYHSPSSGNNQYGNSNDNDNEGAGAYPFSRKGSHHQDQSSGFQPNQGSSNLGYDGNNANYRGNDEESADEDDGAPAAPLPSSDGYPRVAAATKVGVRGSMIGRNGPLNLAASQYNRHSAPNGRQQNHYQHQQIDSNDQERRPTRGSNQMMVAANGYAPFGYGASGPVDLGAIMANLAGEQNNQGYQVYQGDGSYPGQQYYNQQGNNQRNNARHQQAASRNNGYGYGPNQDNNENNNNGYSEDGPVGPRSSAGASGGSRGAQARNRDTDDGENEADED